MFRAAKRPSSGEITVSMRHLVFVTLPVPAAWYLSLCPDDWSAGPGRPDSHLYRATNNKCRMDTVISPDDGHIVARNM